MDLKELNKTQLVLLTLLITFIVSIATGIVTVSLMQQMPKSVPQTINNVIQRTIEKVTTVQAPVVTNDSEIKAPSLLGDGDVAVLIYSIPADTKTGEVPVVTDSTNSTFPSEGEVIPSDTTTPTNTTTETTLVSNEPKPLGEGIIISDVGLILVDSSILTSKDTYRVVLSKTDFNATILKKFTNGFTILKIIPKTITPSVPSSTDKNTSADTKNSKLDIKQ